MLACMYPLPVQPPNPKTLSHSCLLFCKPSLPTHLPPPSKGSPPRCVDLHHPYARFAFVKSQRCQWSPARTAGAPINLMGDPGGQWEIPLVMGCLNFHGGAIWHLICVHICLGGWNSLPCYLRGLFWKSSHQQKIIPPQNKNTVNNQGRLGPFSSNTLTLKSPEIQEMIYPPTFTYDINHRL